MHTLPMALPRLPALPFQDIAIMMRKPKTLLTSPGMVPKKVMLQKQQ